MLLLLLLSIILTYSIYHRMLYYSKAQGTS